jgi:hypothetical protein
MRTVGSLVLTVLVGSAAHADEAPGPAKACADCACASASPDMALIKTFPARDWKEPFSKAAELAHAVGDYPGAEPWKFESLSLKMNQPSSTAKVEVKGAGGALLITDSEPGLKKNRHGPPAWAGGKGAVTVTGWVDVRFDDVQVRGVVNAARSTKSQSRQGLLARWDRHHKYYWFNVDFGTGKTAISKQSPGVATSVPLPGSELAIPGFERAAAYTLEFVLLGRTLQGKVYDGDGTLLVDTGPLEDPEPFVCGISGVNAELSLGAPLAPLVASFSDVSATAPKTAH